MTRLPQPHGRAASGIALCENAGPFPAPSRIRHAVPCWPAPQPTRPPEPPGIRFQLYQAPDAELLASIADQFDRLEDGRRLTTHQSAFGHCFIKTTPIRSLSRRLRITFGLPSPGKGLDWELVELVNHLQAEALGIPCPRLLGYGYRTRAGLVDALCLIYEYLDGQCDGAEWLGRHPERAPELLATLCEAVLDLHGKRAYPLDLWLGNLMLSPQDPSRLTFIDFESCCFGTSPHIDAVLGLIFGQLYYGTLKATFRDFLSEAQFDASYAPTANDWQHWTPTSSKPPTRPPSTPSSTARRGGGFSGRGFGDRSCFKPTE